MGIDLGTTWCRACVSSADQGAVLYEMLTRHPPFDDDSLALCWPNTATRKDQDRRYQTAEELASALDTLRQKLFG